MNVLDAVLLLMLLLAAVRGFRRGALVLVGSLVGAVLGLILGAAVGPDVAARFIDEPGLTLGLTTVGIMLGGLVLGQALGVALGVRLRRVVQRVGAQPVDRILGIVLSIATFVVLVWLLASAFAQGPSAVVSQQLQSSRVATEIVRALPQAPDVVGRVGAYLDRQGLPQAVAGLGGPIAPPVDRPLDSDVVAAAEAGSPSTVRIEATGCNAASLGSGFVTTTGFVVTNAHVIAGADSIGVHDAEGRSDAVPIHFDPDIDLAVLRAPDVTAPELDWTDEEVSRGTPGATLGFPGGDQTLVPKAAAVRGRGPAVGRDIYGSGQVTRDVLTLSSGVARGDSGGPFVTTDGHVGGVVFATSSADPDMGYALAVDEIRDDVDSAVSANEAVDAGPCRF